jgi:hypothetical protein
MVVWSQAEDDNSYPGPHSPSGELRLHRLVIRDRDHWLGA